MRVVGDLTRRVRAVIDGEVGRPTRIARFTRVLELADGLRVETLTYLPYIKPRLGRPPYPLVLKALEEGYRDIVKERLTFKWNAIK